MGGAGPSVRLVGSRSRGTDDGLGSGAPADALVALASGSPMLAGAGEQVMLQMFDVDTQVGGRGAWNRGWTGNNKLGWFSGDSNNGDGAGGRRFRSEHQRPMIVGDV